MIWILLPAYNEIDSLPNLLPKLNDVLKDTGHDYKILIVDDGSNDGTEQQLENYQSKMPIDVITHKINRGLGETERDGYEYVALNGSPNDIMIRMDCDDTHEPKYIPSIIHAIDNGADVVITSRFQDGGGQVGVNGYRAFISRGASLFMKVVFNIPEVRDYSCGYRGYRVSVLKDAIRVFGNNFIQLRGLGFTSTLETIVKLNLLGARTKEVPFVLRYDQKVSSSKMSSLITILGYLTMAILYHYPVSGWRSQYRGLREIYRHNPSDGIEQYKGKVLPVQTQNRLKS